MQAHSTSVGEYLGRLPADRRKALTEVRKVILKNLDKTYQEGIQYGMIGYSVPHSVFPKGYHCDPTQPLPFAGLSSWKTHMSIHMFCIYGDDQSTEWLRGEFLKAGKKLDMGKACIRFRKLEDLPLEVIGAAIKRMPAKKWIANYEAQLAAMPAQREARRAAKANAKGGRARPGVKKAGTKGAKTSATGAKGANGAAGAKGAAKSAARSPAADARKKVTRKKTAAAA